MVYLNIYTTAFFSEHGNGRGHFFSWKILCSFSRDKELIVCVVEEGIRQEMVFQNQIIERQLNHRTKQELLWFSKLITFRCVVSLVTYCNPPELALKVF